ncbi:hypothetical protein DV515_00011798 [Chloebia gouldiae]|uniref:Uncharacterized protein n=1 Tax=Chloebia gouldiae TaxID=44316 RepID=A0A3L8S6G3_CHLGU|nr:hypothetical protein DV515_00011798 [Chloebia gouldiae]
MTLNKIPAFQEPRPIPSAAVSEQNGTCGKMALNWNKSQHGARPQLTPPTPPGLNSLLQPAKELQEMLLRNPTEFFELFDLQHCSCPGMSRSNSRPGRADSLHQEKSGHSKIRADKSPLKFLCSSLPFVAPIIMIQIRFSSSPPPIHSARWKHHVPDF